MRTTTVEHTVPTIAIWLWYTFVFWFGGAMFATVFTASFPIQAAVGVAFAIPGSYFCWKALYSDD